MPLSLLGFPTDLQNDILKEMNIEEQFNLSQCSKRIGSTIRNITKQHSYSAEMQFSKRCLIKFYRKNTLKKHLFDIKILPKRNNEGGKTYNARKLRKVLENANIIFKGFDFRITIKEESGVRPTSLAIKNLNLNLDKIEFRPAPCCKYSDVTVDHLMKFNCKQIFTMCGKIPLYTLYPFIQKFLRSDRMETVLFEECRCQFNDFPIQNILRDIPYTEVRRVEFWPIRWLHKNFPVGYRLTKNNGTTVILAIGGSSFVMSAHGINYFDPERQQFSSFISELDMSIACPGYYFFPMIAGYNLGIEFIRAHYCMTFYLFMFAFELPSALLCFIFRNNAAEEIRMRIPGKMYLKKVSLFLCHLFPFAVAVSFGKADLTYQQKLFILRTKWPECIEWINAGNFEIYDYNLNPWLAVAGIGAVSMVLVVYT
ncbi:hypothetical protein L5515_002287 [Caenorhabditis briggsae]|uniref:F-box domain-containing protein n=1 Tax=Caenorhabditis briggsae TaxID=6238 RepID=A0AAE9E7M9_CAEBR|nr:hypothetical protein L5515_002287 [Caenorhabditis briggsae]